MMKTRAFLIIPLAFFGPCICFGFNTAPSLRKKIPSQLAASKKKSVLDVNSNIPGKISDINPLKLKRRDIFTSVGIFGLVNLGVGKSSMISSQPAYAYTPDSDKLRESLYLISRVQEATVQQQRLVSNGKLQEDLKKKMTLSLRLVERSYRLLDQINYASNFVSPMDEIVVASEAGNEAAEALQSAIDYVKDDLGNGPITTEQRTFLLEALTETREKLFIFLKYMPQQKLLEARIRVEEENVKNREEYDGDADAGVFNPVKLPWK